MQRPVSTGWADEFAVQQQQQVGPGNWAEEFSGQQEGGTASDWVQGFAQEQEEAAASRHGSTAATADAQATSARLVAALSADGDPKMKNSKFLQFLSKMSKGELMFEDNKVCTGWWGC
jgi:peroxin-5